MSDSKFNQEAKEIVLEAKIIRADGSVEELGVISYWHENPLKRWAWRLRCAAEGILNGKRSN